MFFPLQSLYAYTKIQIVKAFSTKKHKYSVGAKGSPFYLRTNILCTGNLLNIVVQGSGSALRFLPGCVFGSAKNKCGTAILAGGLLFFI
jgi:hypothetical protein